MRGSRGVLWLLLIGLLKSADGQLNADQQRQQKMKTIDELRLNGPQYRQIEKLHLDGYVSAMAALVGAVGRETLRKLGTSRYSI